MSSIGASHDRRAKRATKARRDARNAKRPAVITDYVPDGYPDYPVSGDSITAFMGVKQTPVAGSLWERVAS